MNSLDFQRYYYIPGHACLLVPNSLRLKPIIAPLRKFARSTTLEYNKTTTLTNSKGMTRSLFQDFRVDFRSCEHTYDPTRFINNVRPLSPLLTSFLPVKLF